MISNNIKSFVLLKYNVPSDYYDCQSFIINDCPPEIINKIYEKWNSIVQVKHNWLFCSPLQEIIIAELCKYESEQ